MEVDVSHPTQVSIRDGGCRVICEMGDGAPIRGLVLNVYGTNCDGVIQKMAQALGAVAYDISDGKLVS